MQCHRLCIGIRILQPQILRQFLVFRDTYQQREDLSIRGNRSGLRCRLRRQTFFNLENFAANPTGLCPLRRCFPVSCQRIAVHFLPVENRGFLDQSHGILRIRLQHFFKGRKFGFNCSRERIKQNDFAIGFRQTARHADPVVLLARNRHTDHLGQETGIDWLGYTQFPGLYLERLRVEQNLAALIQHLRVFGGAIEKTGRPITRSQRISRKQNVARTHTQGRFVASPQYLAARCRKNQPDGFFFGFRRLERQTGNHRDH